MAYSIDDINITTTRGDSFLCLFPMYIEDQPYELREGDRVTFAVKEDWEDQEPCIYKELDGYLLYLQPHDTKGLDMKKYYYDVKMRFASGYEVTYITKARFILDKEAH